MKTRKVLLHKIGRSPDPFIVNDSNNVNKGRSFDYQIELYAEAFMASGFEVHMSNAMWNTMTRPETADQAIEFKNKHGVEVIVDFDSYKVSETKFDYVLVLAGKGPIAQDTNFIEWLSKTKHNYLYILNDAKYADYSFMPYKPKAVLHEGQTSFYRDEVLWKNNLTHLKAVSNLLVQKHRSSNVLVWLSQRGSIGYERVEKLIQYAKANPQLTFDVYGVFTDMALVERLSIESNINHYSKRVSLDEYYRISLNYYYTLVLPNTQGFNGIKELAYAIRPQKVYDARSLGLVPLIDVSGFFRSFVEPYSLESGSILINEPSYLHKCLNELKLAQQYRVIEQIVS